MIKITIITVTYNCVNTIERTIRSVINQTYRNIEYIICDGASTDGTAELIEKYGDSIAFYISEPDTGVYNAMNKALSHVTGDVVEFLNGDDYIYDSEVLSRVAKVFSDEPDTDILVGKEAMDIVSGIHHPESYTNIYIDAIFPHQAVFAKKRVFDEIGFFDERYQICGDRDWLLNAWNKGYKFVLRDDIYVYFEPGGSSFGFETPLEEYLVAKKYLIKTRRIDLLGIAQKRCVNDFVNRYVDSVFGLEGRIQIQARIWKKYIPNKKCIVWGQGKYGTFFIQSLLNCRYDVLHIIDNSMKKSEYAIKVGRYCPREIDVPVVISASLHDKELVKMMKDDNILDDYIISFESIRRSVIEFVDQVDGIRDYFKERTGFNLGY